MKSRTYSKHIRYLSLLCALLWVNVMVLKAESEAPSTLVEITEVILTNPTCGLSNGSIEITATISPGSDPANNIYELNFGVFSQMDNTFVDLPAGVYFITVEDDAGCVSNFMQVELVNEDGSLTIEGSVECRPDSNIDIDITVSGGSPAFTFSWTGPGGYTSVAEDPMGVTPGTYNVTATDMNGCSGEASFTMNECTSSMASFCDATVNNPRCVGDTNGSIVVSPSGGSGGYTFNWSHIGSGSNFVQGLSAGNYDVTIMDSAGESEVCRFTLIAPTEMTINDLILSQPSCSDDDGEITFDVTPSVTSSLANLMYSIDGGVSFQSSPTFSMLSTGDYFLFVRDEHGCQVGTTTSLAFDTGGLIATSMGGCESPDNIFVNTSVMGGAAPYTYAWSGTGGYTSSLPDIASAPVGTYVLTVTDQVGCTASTNITLTNCCSFDDLCNATVVDAQCGVTGGSITVNPTSTITPFTYAWQHDPSNTTNSATNLVSGVYNVTVTDGNGCAQNCNYQIGDGSSVSIGQVDVVDATCDENNGTITIGLQTVPACAVEYSIDGGNTYQASETFTGLAAGDYILFIRDCNGCTDGGDMAEVLNSEGPSLEIDMLMCTMNGTLDAFVTTFSGTSPFTYAWTGPAGFTATTEDIVDVPQGLYNLVVTDANGCTFEIEIEKNDCELPDLCGALISQPICIGDNTGSITCMPEGTGPFTYMWSHDPGLTSNTAIGLDVGTYFVTVTGSSSSDVCSYVLTAPDEISISLTNASCTPSATVDIDISVQFGTPPYSYAWTGPGGFTASTQDITNGPQGSYSVVVTDATNCGANYALTIDDCVRPDLCNASLTDPSCNGDIDGSITVNPSEGTAPYTYNWAHDGALSSNAATGLVAGSYSVTVTDANNAMSFCQYDLTNPPGMVVSLTNANCTASGTVDINVSVQNGTAPYSYAWTGPSGYTASTANVTNGPQGFYALVVTDASGCVANYSTTIDNCTPPDLCNANLTDPTCSGDADGSIIINPMDGTAPYSYAWSHDAALTSNNASGLVAGNYTATVSDANGAQSVCEFEIINPDQLIIYDFNVAHPNCTSTGSIELILGVLTGSSSSPYTGSGTGISYSIDGGSQYYGSPFFPNLSAGTYNTLVRDANGCISPMEPVELMGSTACATIGDFVWHDINGDGNQSPGEPGFPNVRVYLYDGNGVLVAATFTDANGFYLFEELHPGDYFIKIDAPTGYDVTFANHTNSDTNDSDIDDSNGPGTSAITSLVNNENDLSWDAGLYKCVPVGDYVWLDYNHNETQDITENGINGIKVNIYISTPSGFVLYESTYTGHKPGTPSDDGYYKFCVPPGTYYVEFVTNPESLTIVNSGFGSAIDSDVTDRFGPGTTNAFTVQSEGMNCDIDAGYYIGASIGDRVFVDNNFNGIQDNGDTPLANTNVRLLDENGNVMDQTVSDNAGKYIFNEVALGRYYVEFDTPPGYSPTTKHVGNAQDDSDVNTNMQTDMIEITVCEQIMTIDAGFTSGLVLPVEWLSFTGEHQGTHNYLIWETAEEIDNAFFEIERRVNDSQEFESIGRILSGNNSQSFNGMVYEILDNDLYTDGIYYYRIKQVDINGRFSYSKVVALEVRESSIDVHAVSIFPNPANDLINVTFLTEIETEATIQIFDIIGQRVIEPVEVMTSLGENKFTFDISNYTKGAYTINVKYKGRVLAENFVKI